MKLFGRKRRPEAETIAEFWQWWAGARDDVARAIRAGTVPGLADEIGQRVHLIHPDLHWELAPGGLSEHALAVTPGGRPHLRAVAARWLAVAPPADRTWSYRSVRAADLSTFESTIELDGHRLELADIRYGIAADEQRRQLDVVCYHPGFAALPDDVRRQITFLTLDWALGEDDVETWLGGITWTGSEPADPRTPAELRKAVSTLAANEDSWTLMQGERKGMPVLALAASPLRPARWPRFDLHMAVRLPYQRYHEGLLPVDESLDALRRFEDELGAAIGANGTIVAHETGDRLRTLHFYLDAQTNARAEIESRLGQWREGRASAAVRLDPAFEQVRHLMP